MGPDARETGDYRTTFWNRRGFLRGALHLSLAPGLLRMFPGAAPVIAVAGLDGDTAVARGAALGREEALHTAELLGRRIVFRETALPRAGSSPESTLEGLSEVAAVVAAPPAGASEALERAVDRAGLLLVDVRPAHLGRAADRRVFRIGPPREVLAAAASSEAAEAEVVLWHPSLFRYGAQQLNERFRRRFGTGMTGEAWAGWMGIKLLAESLLRIGSASPDDLVAHLESPRVAFDGHKGVPLSFTSEHQLEQPLYVVTDQDVQEVAWPGGHATPRTGRQRPPRRG